MQYKSIINDRKRADCKNTTARWLNHHDQDRFQANINYLGDFPVNIVCSAVVRSFGACVVHLTFLLIILLKCIRFQTIGFRLYTAKDATNRLFMYCQIFGGQAVINIIR